MAQMNSRERVLAALNHQEVDRVPWVESYVSNFFAKKLLGYEPVIPGTARTAPDVLKVLAIDSMNYNFMPPRCARDEQMNEVEFVAEGLLKTWDDLEKFKATLPDPTDDKFYEQGKEFLKTYGDDKCIFAAVRFGIEHTFLSMGIEHFGMMLYDDPKFVHATMEMFTDFTCKTIDRINEMGFHGYFVSDDQAYRSGPFISYKHFQEFFYPYMKKCADRMKLPWIYHSCGNIMPIMDDLLSLGMNAIANIEPGPMDINEVKKKYGDKVCIVGNIDLHYTLTRGTVEETIAEVKDRIKNIAPGGNYIIASSNGLTSYCKPENIKAMNDTILKYGNYPIVVD